MWTLALLGGGCINDFFLQENVYVWAFLRDKKIARDPLYYFPCWPSSWRENETEKGLWRDSFMFSRLPAHLSWRAFWLPPDEKPVVIHHKFKRWKGWNQDESTAIWRRLWVISFIVVDPRLAGLRLKIDPLRCFLRRKTANCVSWLDINKVRIISSSCILGFLHFPHYFASSW